MNPLITQLVEATIDIAKTQLEHKDATDALPGIIESGVETIEEHTGEPLDPALIKVEDPL
jgi:hypothetical protein